MFKKLTNKVEDKMNKKAQSTTNKIAKRAMLAMAPVIAHVVSTLLLFVIILGPIFALISAFTYYLEQKTHEDTINSLYSAVEEITGSQEINKTVKIEKEENGSYYYKFVEGIIEKLEGNLKNSNTRYVELGLKDSSLLKIFLEAQLTTQLPDLNGTKVASINTTVDSVIDEKGEITTENQIVVAIMAGHNKTETGASYNELREEEMTIKVAKQVEEIIKSDARGRNIKIVQVGSTEENPNVPDAGRLQKALEANPKMLISIHFNSSEGHNLNGVSICYNKAGTAQYTENGTTRTVTTEDSSEESRRLGAALKATVADSMGLSTTYDYEKPLFTIGGQREGFPSVIIEGGYIDGSNDYQKFSSQKDEMLKKYAQGIVDGVYRYLGI